MKASNLTFSKSQAIDFLNTRERRERRARKMTSLHIKCREEMTYAFYQNPAEYHYLME
jgi:hypothetical protein